MDISTTPTAANRQQTIAGQSQANAVLSSDFETFLQMLTAQARFQDPLEPIDSTEYAAQLAQFSMVEQQVLSNDLLSALTEQLTADRMGAMASWIGMEARTTAPVAFDGTPTTLLPKLDTTAEEAILIVSDLDGNEVQRLPIPTGTGPIDWDGASNEGGQVPPGVYQFSVESRTAGQVLSTTPVETYARITEAQRSGGETIFTLQGGSIVGATEIKALREPF